MYDVDYFIAKFEAVPHDDWCVGEFSDGKGRQCALGICGYIGRPAGEAQDLMIMFRKYQMVADSVNDGYSWRIELGPMPDNPKDRIITALRWIKEQQK